MSQQQCAVWSNPLYKDSPLNLAAEIHGAKLTTDLKAFDDATLSKWINVASEQLLAGWNDAAVRGSLVKLGCPRDLAQQVLESAKRHSYSTQRRSGLILFVVGVVLVVAGLGIVAVQLLVFGNQVIAVPSGLAFVGLGCCLRGALRAFFGR